MPAVKVLHIAPGFLYGGIESRLVDWYKCIDRDKVRFDVVKVTPDIQNDLVDEIEKLGGKVYTVPPLGLKTIGQHIQGMRKIINDNQYDVVHSHSLPYGYIALKLAKKSGCKRRILHSRTVRQNPGDRMVMVKEILGHMSIKYATDFFACSQEAGIAAFGNKRTFTVIQNGIFLNDFIFDSECRRLMRQRLEVDSSFVLGFVGRFSTAKNIPFLCEVFSLVHDSFPDTTLLIIGDAQENTDIKNQCLSIVKAHNAQDDIIFAGRQNDVGKWLNTMDVLLMPSLFEGFGTVAVEAQANGLPCVLSDTVPQMTKVSDDAYYLPLDRVDTWVETIAKLRNKKRIGGNIQKIRDLGYDVATTAKWLQEFYLK